MTMSKLALEAEAYRRAVLGVMVPVFHRGEIIAHKVSYSDILLRYLLKKQPFMRKQVLWLLVMLDRFLIRCIHLKKRYA